MSINDDLFRIDVSISFFLVDVDLMVSPFSELMKSNQKFGLEHIMMSSNIEFELPVKVLDFDSQFS